MRVLILDFIEEKAQQVTGCFLHLGCAANAQERSVALDDVEMGVHCLRRVGVFVAQAHVGYGLPVACGCLDVAALNAIAAVGLDNAEEIHCKGERLLVGRNAVIFREAVNHEADGVELLLCIGGSAVGIHTPVRSAEFAVDEVLHDVIFRTGCVLKVLGTAQHAVGGGESPEDAGVEDGALCGIGVEAVVAVAAAIVTAARIRHFLHPVGKDIFGQVLNEFL